MMNNILFFAESTVGPDLVGKGRYLSSTTVEWLIILGAIGLVCAVAIAWAVYVRKPQKEHRHHHHRHSATQASGGGDGEGAGRRRRKWRRRRRDHRPRNPTLAETGGLPPIRPQGPPPP